MEKIESNNQINIKLLIIEIFPPLEEINDNNSEITISFEDKYNEISFDLTEVLLYQKELDLSFNAKSSHIKIIINKNDNLYASGILSLKNGDQWVTLLYENKKRHIYSNLTLSLMDCIKLKINCKIISKDESSNNISFNLMRKGSTNVNSFNLIRKGNHILNQKRRTTPKKIDSNYLTQYSFNIDHNKKINKYIEQNIKTPMPIPYTAYTTINKNSIKKIELSANQSNKCMNRKINYLNYNNLRNDNKNISSAYPLNTKNSHKLLYKKKGEDEINGLSSDIKPKKKNKGNKQSLEDININYKKNKSCSGIKMENSKSSKTFIKRKSGKGQQIDLMDQLYDTNNNIYSKEYNAKNNPNIKTEENNYIKKKSSGDKVNGIKKINPKDNLVKTPNGAKKNRALKNLVESNDIENNDTLLNMIKEYKKENNNNIDKDKNIINYDINKIQDDNKIMGNNMNENENKLKKSYNSIVNLIDDDIYNDNDIFTKHLEDFKLLYSNEYIKSITNDYIKLEIELFIEKVIELTSIYNNQIEEKNYEYQILKNKYYKNMLPYIEIQKLLNKLNYIKFQYQLKKYNIQKIKSSNNNNSKNNLITNKKQIKIFKDNLLEEIQKKIKSKNETLKKIIKKLYEKEKIKKIVDKNEKYKTWIKNNFFKKDDKKKKDKNIKTQKHNSKKILNNKNNINDNNKLHTKKNSNKISYEPKGKNKNKK